MGPPATEVQQAVVQVQITPYPIGMTLGGTIPEGSANDLAVGQILAARVITGSLPTSANDTYTWKQPGCMPFENYTTSYTSPTQTSGTFVPFLLPTGIGLNCYFGVPGTTSVQCTYYNATTGITVMLSQSVTVYGPTRSEYFVNIGDMQLTDYWNSPEGWGPGAFNLWGAPGPAYFNPDPWGTWHADEITDPEFVQETYWLDEDYGEWSYVQFLNADYATKGKPGEVVGLDNTFPYGVDSAQPNGDTYDATGDLPNPPFSDAPGDYWEEAGYEPTPVWSFQMFLWNTDLPSSFMLYLYYLPPNDSAGPSVCVPIEQMNWNSLGQTTLNTWGNWLQQDNGSDLLEEIAYPAQPYPQWPPVFINNYGTVGEKLVTPGGKK